MTPPRYAGNGSYSSGVSGPASSQADRELRQEWVIRRRTAWHPASSIPRRDEVRLIRPGPGHPCDWAKRPDEIAALVGSLIRRLVTPHYRSGRWWLTAVDLVGLAAAPKGWRGLHQLTIGTSASRVSENRR